MKYNGFYFWMFQSQMKKVLKEKYGGEYAAEIMKKSRRVYRELVEKADDIGDDNPMAYNELFALAFVAPYVASEKKIPPETVQEMMRRALPRKVVFCDDRPEHGQGQGGEQEERRQICRVVHPGKGEAVPDVFQGGLCRPAA